MVPVVALRKESVDRNTELAYCINDVRWSLSARRAWIEMQNPGNWPPCTRSLSARRAWIEIVGGAITAYPVFPSLSARRAWIEI